MLTHPLLFHSQRSQCCNRIFNEADRMQKMGGCGGGGGGGGTCTYHPMPSFLANPCEKKSLQTQECTHTYTHTHTLINRHPTTFSRTHTHSGRWWWWWCVCVAHMNFHRPRHRQIAQMVRWDRISAYACVCVSEVCACYLFVSLRAYTHTSTYTDT